MFSSDERNFLSNNKMIPANSGVETNFKKMKLVSSVSEGLLGPNSYCD